MKPGGSTGVGRRLAFGALILLPILWGSTFFSIKRVVATIPVSDFLAVRFFLASVVLVVVFHRAIPRLTWRTWRHGLILGAAWAAAQLLQTNGLARTSASISGFVTGLYVVFTPILGLIVFRARVLRWVWGAVGLATIGLAALTIHPEAGTVIGLGETLTIGCAVVYAIHIVLLGRWSTAEEAAGLTVVQTLSMTAVFVIFALPGGIQLPTTAVNWVWMVYLAVFAGAITLLLQTWAQAHIEPSTAAVLMCAEPLWATVFAIWFGGEHLTWLFVGGAIAILGAMYLVIRPPGRRARPAVDGGDLQGFDHRA